MPYTNYLGGLKREFHHVKTNHNESEDWEPTMILLHYQKPGKSFIIPLSAFWKYIEPIDNQEAYPSDLKEFQKIIGRAIKDQRIANLLEGEMKVKAKKQTMDDLQACAFASALWNENKILPTVGWNLFKMMVMFDIEPRPESAAQLLLFIQDGLDELKNMPDVPEEKGTVAGEVDFSIDGQKVMTKELRVRESDLIMEEGEA